jgi:pyruvate/2-oxoglutarate dehydrogenase complex dihydrolipoamide dehydrogenase (E3) component
MAVLRTGVNALGDGPPMAMDRTVVPNGIFTYSDLATLGLRAAAPGHGHEGRLGRARFAGEAKALAEGESEGHFSWSPRPPAAGC